MRRLRPRLALLSLACLVAPACAPVRATSAGTIGPALTARAVLSTVSRALPAEEDSRGAPLGATLPDLALAATRLAVDEAGGAWIDLSPLDVEARAAVAIGEARVFRDVAPATDLVWMRAAGGVEELRVLREAGASTRARYRVRTGAAIAALRVRAGRAGDVIEVVDRAGDVRLASAPLFAIDARGARRAVTARVERDPSGGYALETELDPRGLAYPIVVDPAWATVPPMASARTGHTSSLLPGQRALVVGGVDASNAAQSTAEIFDRNTKAWSAAPPMKAKRAGHTATVLSDGRVLIIGGASAGSSLSTVEVYDPASNAWSDRAAMPQVRAAHTATLLAGDLVLVVGGTDQSPGGEWADAVIYTPSGDAWAPAGTMSIGRQHHAAALLSSGKVLVTGGRRGGGNIHSTAELWDPATKTFADTGAMTTRRVDHTISVLSGDRPLVVGGRGLDKVNSIVAQSTAELFDVATGTWTATSAMTATRSGHVAIALPQDRVLVLGGGVTSPSVPSAELWLPTLAHFESYAPLALNRSDPGATLLPSAELLVSGGLVAAVASANVELLAVGANGATCTDGARECASGLCVDGVCCDVACDGQCEACDVVGSVGTCVPAVGAPHGKRAACDLGSAICDARHCDGADRKTCAAFADAGTECAAASCADGSAKIAAKCDGAGGCPAVVAAPCAPYACGGDVCKTSCKADPDCGGANVCDVAKGICVAAKAATCSDDGLSSQPLAGALKACAPRRCDPDTGNCFLTCTSTDQCAPGTTCDTTSGECTTVAAGGDSGGCVVVDAGADGLGASAVWGGVVAIGAALRSARRRRAPARREVSR